MNKKLHAFTLSETLMSMTILTFVVLVGFFAYQYIHQYFNAYRERSRELTILSESCFVLKHDIIYANYLYKEDSVLKVGDPGDTVKYSFFHSHFEREKHGQSDTIPLKGLSLEDIAEIDSETEITFMIRILENDWIWEIGKMKDSFSQFE